uniref:MADF domain-containing protein n=1 Tax=Musca domestica TaxID=7370 RepID=A0A1I8N6W3_MUSDO
MNLVELIEAVKKEPNIYKNLHEDDDEFQSEWQSIANKFCVSIDEVQRNWNRILYEYMEYLKGNDDFELAKYMDFLQPYMFTMIDDTSIDEEELKNILKDDDDVQEVSQDLDKSPENVLEENQEKQERGEETQEICFDEPTPPCIAVNTTPAEGKSQIDLVDTAKVPETVAKEKSQTPPAMDNNTSTKNDPSFTNLTSMELIFLGYAKQLQKMPLSLQLKTKRKIADIMDDAELQMMEGL